ncbi:unnamed protein product [Ectocarpus fasciculatus]
MENGMRSKLDWEQGRGGYGLRDLEEFRPTHSINSFVKGDYARLEKAFHATRGGVYGNNDMAATRCTQFKELPKSNTISSRKHVRDRPGAASTCRELHQLIRDTVGLVDVLTSQAVELEQQGWNRLPEPSQIDKRSRTAR